MIRALTKARRTADVTLLLDAAGAVSLVVMLVGALHLPTLV